MPEKAITKTAPPETEAKEQSLVQARQFLARLRIQLRPQTRNLIVWGTLTHGLALLYVVALAWLISQWAEKSLLVADSWGYALLVVGVLVLRGLTMRRFDQSAEQLMLQSQQQASEDLLGHWRARAGLQVPSAEVSLLHDAIPALGPYYARFVPQLWFAVAIPVTILVLVFWLDWIAGLFLLFSAPLIPLFMALVGMGAERLNAQHFDSVQRLSGLFIDRLRNLVGITLFERRGHAVAQIEKASALSKALNMKTLKVAFLSSAVLEFFSAVAIAAVAIYVGFALLGYYQWGPAGEMTWFVGLLLLMLAPEFFQPLRTLASYYHDRAAAIAAAGRLAAAKDIGEAPADSVRAQERGAQAPTIDVPVLSINALVVGYQEDLLPAISMTLQGGDLLWIQGASGAGKSTLLKTLAGLISARAGTARFNEQDTHSITVAYLAQQPFFQHDTLRENLRLMAPTATDTEMKHALETMGLSEFFALLPNGLDTQIGPNHFGLSGGEARRVALARIALAQSPLILLDEPTAGLDALSAAAVVEAIQRLQGVNRIIVIASHDSQCQNMATQRLMLEAAL